MKNILAELHSSLSYAVRPEYNGVVMYSYVDRQTWKYGRLSFEYRMHLNFGPLTELIL